MNETHDGGALVAEGLVGWDGPEPDRIARLAVRALNVPIVLIVVPVGDHAILVGRAGLPDGVAREVPLTASFAGRVATSGVCTDAGALAGTWEAGALGARAAIGVPVTDADGTVRAALVVADRVARTWTADDVRAAQDLALLVTDEVDRRDAHARCERAERYQLVVERSPEAILVHVDGLIQFANAAAVSLLGGAEPADLLGRSIEDFLSRPYLKHVEESLTVSEPSNVPPPVTEERLTRLDGVVRYVELASLGYLKGWAPAVQIFIRDVTDRREAREALRAREAHLRLLLDRMPALTWTTDAALGMRLARARVDPAEAVTTVQAFFGKSEEEVPVCTHRRALTGESASGILEWKGGEYEVRVEPLRDDTGEVVGTVGVAIDATLRRRAEARQREEHALYELGRVAGGVAHGVNNALAAMVGTASLLHADAALSEPVKRSLQVILDAGASAHELTSNLIGYARQGRYRNVRLQLNTLASEAAEWALEQRRGVVVDLATLLPTVAGEPSQLRQAVINVCQNALDATRAGGTVRITTRREVVRGRDAEHPDLDAGVYACLEVRDTGVGMSEEVRGHAVEPFFTTKDVGVGAGMGLAMVHGVLRHHGGDLRIVSTPGVGTTVTMCLPDADGMPLSAPANVDVPPAEAAPRPDRNVVLVVDDDEWVLYSSSMLLESLGYEVVPAPDGPTALERFGSIRDRLAFVLLDLRMPGMDGEEVLRRLLALDPDTRVIICTGFERDQVGQRMFASGRVGFLGKPYTLAALQKEIHEVLAERV